MISKGLKSLLEGLDLLSNEAVFFRNERNGRLFTSFPVETSRKLEAMDADAFFVFNNQPYVLFFDLSGNTDDNKEVEIHRQVWSFDYSPVIFIVKDSGIQIFNAFSFEKKHNRLQEIQLSEKERNERFSFWNLQSGESWRWLQAEHYGTTIQKKRVNQKLFENIRLVRQRLTDQGGNYRLNEDEANILILRLIFIRYLIDRNVKMDDEFIVGKTIEEKRKSFIGLIERPRKLNKFFEQLNDKFNGVLFKDINVTLNKEQATELSWIFSGKPDPVQATLFDDFYFEIFDFSIIPVEVISGIYESLINPETRNEQSAVYTPAFLVEYILTNTIDKYLDEKHTSECKVFDPACGSGIFLVQSYRRMVDREKVLYGDKVKKTRLKEIAQNNLFGIDVNRQALKVTCFSIYIAILDYQDPKTILDNFHFPKLMDENFFEANFFDTGHAFNEVIKQESPDFLLGNPPWKSNKDPIHLKWLKDNNKITGRFEIAQSFLLRSKDFMKLSTLTSLIVTSTIFYNVSKTTRQFKKDFLTQFCLDGFFDLSPVRRLVFEEKDSPAVVVYYRLTNGKSHLNNIVHHQSIKWNVFLKYYKTLIIEKFDQKQIQQKHFIENDWMFKVALYGGVLDYSFLKKISSSDQKLEVLVKNNNFEKGDGIYKGSPKRQYDFLIQKSVVDTQDIKPYYTAVNEGLPKLTKEDVYLESGRNEKLFTGTTILLKHRAQNESEIVVSYASKNVVFRHGVYGITAKTDIGILNLLYGIFVSDLYTYFQFITTSSWGIATRPEIKLEEYMSFPYNGIDSDSKTQLIDLVSTFLKPFAEYYKSILKSPQLPISKDVLNNINALINNVYHVNEYEHDLIDYVLNVSRYQFQESKQHKFTKRVDNDEVLLRQYAHVFLQELGHVYEQEKMTIEVYNLNHFVAMNFVFTETDYSKDEAACDKIIFISHNSTEKEVLQRIASNLSISKMMSSTDPSKNIFIQKDIKGFEENSFYIIKPNEYKCWHRAMAWYDIAEIKEAIEQAELNHLKGNR